MNRAVLDEEDRSHWHILVENQLIAVERFGSTCTQQSTLLGGPKERKKPRSCRYSLHRALHVLANISLSQHLTMPCPTRQAAACRSLRSCSLGSEWSVPMLAQPFAGTERSGASGPGRASLSKLPPWPSRPRPSSCQNSPKDRDRVQRCGPFVTRAYLTPFCCLRFVTSPSLPARLPTSRVPFPDPPRDLALNLPASAWRKVTCM